MYHFLTFDFRPSIWIIIVNVFLNMMAFLIAVFVAHLISFNLISFFVPFIIMHFDINVILSRFKYLRQGAILISNNGIEILGIKKNKYLWGQVDSLSVTKVNHILIDKLGRVGGFFRFNHIGYNELSFQTYDRLEINGDIFYIFIRNKSESRLFNEAIELIKKNKPSILAEVFDYRLRDIFI